MHYLFSVLFHRATNKRMTLRGINKSSFFIKASNIHHQNLSGFIKFSLLLQSMKQIFEKLCVEIYIYMYSVEF